MRTIRNAVITFAAMVVFVPFVCAQDLSKYRKFSLGTSLAQVSKQVGPDSNGPNLIHERPAVIQEVTSWSVGSSRSSEQVDQISEILFSFYNGELYRIEVSYDSHATEGLTAEDMVQAVSALYGTATRPAAEIHFPTRASYDSKEKVIARWEDSQNSISLFRSSSLDSFGLVVLSKRADADAETAIIESAKLDKEEGPQKEVDRQKKEAENLEVARQINRKTFHP